MINSVGQWGYQTGNVEGLRKTASFGTAVASSASANTYGSYVSLLAGSSILYDCCWVTICINGIGISGGARDAICTIGVDQTGGTSYVDWIPHLLCGQASSHLQILNGCWYSFPLFVKAGSRIGAKLSCNVTGAPTGNVAIWLDGQPRNPLAFDVGYNGVEAIGVNIGTSSGTPITPGTTSQGAWTSIGSSVGVCKYWNVGVGISDGSLNDFVYGIDGAIGNASFKHLIIKQATAFSSASPDTMSFRQSEQRMEWIAAAGSALFGRAWCAGNGGDGNLSMAMYGVRA